MADVPLGDRDVLARCMVGASGVTLGLCTAVVAPYGRYSRSVVFGIRFPLVNAKAAWCLMESPNVIMALWCLSRSSKACRDSPANVILLVMFVLHYLNRSLVFPARMRGGQPMNLLVMLLATLFCTFNGYLQCSHLLRWRAYPDSWLRDPRFMMGSAAFVAGFLINYQSDGILRRLRGPGDTGYKIPRGGIFEYVSGANYFGECLEWCGFAVAGWSLPGSAFALYTAANLAPRAYWLTEAHRSVRLSEQAVARTIAEHHRWYIDKFSEDYPTSRKALVPFIW